MQDLLFVCDRCRESTIKPSYMTPKCPVCGGWMKKTEITKEQYESNMASDSYIQQIKEDKERLEQSTIEKNYSQIMLNTTHNFEGYQIEKYLDVVTGETVVPNGLLGALTSGTFFTIDSLTKARRMAMIDVRQKAYRLGANAVIGVDIDISDLDGHGILVSVNGTAVIVKKCVETNEIGNDVEDQQNVSEDKSLSGGINSATAAVQAMKNAMNNKNKLTE